jgi:hypothetical protein
MVDITTINTTINTTISILSRQFLFGDGPVFGHTSRNLEKNLE